MSEAKSPLRRRLDDVRAERGCSLKALTVLAPQNDPFRIDTPARHRDGAWLAETAQELGLGERRIHLRGLHYMVLGRPKPDGTPYTNTEADWDWLSEQAGKAARWLGYIPFDQITDERNSPPVVRIHSPEDPYAYVTTGLDIDIPDAADIEPSIGIEGFDGVQPYKLVFVGEKSSLTDVIGPVAAEYGADLYLPTGEISDTLIYQMARIGSDDGRPMVVLYFSDCDPAGWQMPVSVFRKLQAFKVLEFPELEFQVRRAALTPEQVRLHRLPSTPLKATERRADRWRGAMGIEQTEIDALAALHPRLLRRIAREAVAPFYDATLDQRVLEARGAWLDEAQEVVDDQLGPERLELFREQAAEQLEAMREQVEELKSAVRITATYDDLPEVVIPEAQLPDEDHGTPLADSRWSFAEQCQALINAKAYAE